VSGRPLRIVALIKQVPLGGDGDTLDSAGRLRRELFPTEMNPWCRRAVAQAVSLSEATGGHSTVLTMGPPSAADVLREAVAWGADDAVHLSDPALAGSDCLVTARALAAAVTELGPFDLVLVGRSSVDGSTSAVGTMVAELLGLPFIGPALAITLADNRLSTTLQADGATEAVSVALPAVVAVAERSCPPAKAPTESWPAADVVRTLTTAQLPEGAWGGAASPTRVARVRRAVRTRWPVILGGDLAGQAVQAIDALESRTRIAREPQPAPPAAAVKQARTVVVLSGPAQAPATQALLSEAEAVGRAAGCRVVAVSFPPGCEPRPAAAALAEWVTSGPLPWAVLGATTGRDREILSRLAVRLDAGLMSDLIGVEVRPPDSGSPQLIGLKPSGDGMLAEIVGVGPTQIATLRTGSLEVRHGNPAATKDFPRIEDDPAIIRTDRRGEDDYDALERADIVIGVGRGVDPGHYGELAPLRELLGAELAATRKVTDAGWLPHSRQVGITARDIAPSVYFALGMSGNSNHLSAANRARTVIAVNNDPDARVFSQCDIGIVADWREVVLLLTAELRRRLAVPEPAAG
jgi:electron transfer flavoprotein alpha subunit